MECKYVGISVRLQEGSSVRIDYPVSGKLYKLICDHADQALEYYLLARYAYRHRMDRSFMINSFWAVEHFILALLTQRNNLKKKEDLRQYGGYHQIVKYWSAIKTSSSVEVASALGRFDGYLSKVQGYFLERYPSTRTGTVCFFMGKRPEFSFSDEPKRRVKFSKDASLNLEELDVFASCMIRSHFAQLHECQAYLLNFLDMFESRNLYREDNLHALV